ncbi:hypothetical protein [Chryseobacterium oryctis]|uniref:Lipoprotein n=1 Tax=Chryseobacterium oryctis TaxID=2952618 RepID=A0ABT3HNR0_9FLAO|nr:hypothetical protein [Chryseobacterium oryctis]MCW3161417.1 hypothetical protein [Chryseobacterium oryctis]
MKSIKYLGAIILLWSCSASKNYEGYIFNNQKKPVKNIKVCEQYTTNCITTNDKGFFILKKDNTSIRNLVVFSNNKPIDTIRTVWSQHGEKINYSFIEGKKDALFLKSYNQ